MSQNQFTQNGYNLRSGLTLYPAQQEAIENLLSTLFQVAPAQFVLLTDVSGQVIASKGQNPQIDLVALGSLVAGDLAASQEIARLTGQYQKAQTVLREGADVHTFISEAGHYFALLVQVSTETPLGWARVVIRKTTEQLVELAANPPTDESNEMVEVEEILDSTEFSNFFDEALDDLWTE